MSDTSATTFAGWISIREALTIGEAAIGASAAHVILEYLRGGVFRAMAGKTSIDQEEDDPLITKFEVITPFLWSRLDAEDFWQTGIALFHTADMYNLGEGPRRIRCFDIRVDPDAVRAAFPALIVKPEIAQPPPTIVSQKSDGSRGPTPKEWWDDLWIEMFRRIHFGEFLPKRQADMERAMADWLSENNHTASERTVRNAAKKLFEALREKGQ
jgi:hypothetical protein